MFLIRIYYYLLFSFLKHNMFSVLNSKDNWKINWMQYTDGILCLFFYSYNVTTQIIGLLKLNYELGIILHITNCV